MSDLKNILKDFISSKDPEAYMNSLDMPKLMSLSALFGVRPVSRQGIINRVNDYLFDNEFYKRGSRSDEYLFTVKSLISDTPVDKMLNRGVEKTKKNWEDFYRDKQAEFYLPKEKYNFLTPDSFLRLVSKEVNEKNIEQLSNLLLEIYLDNSEKSELTIKNEGGEIPLKDLIILAKKPKQGIKFYIDPMAFNYLAIKMGVESELEDSLRSQFFSLTEWVRDNNIDPNKENLFFFNATISKILLEATNIEFSENVRVFNYRDNQGYYIKKLYSQKAMSEIGILPMVDDETAKNSITLSEFCHSNTIPGLGVRDLDAHKNYFLSLIENEPQKILNEDLGLTVSNSIKHLRAKNSVPTIFINKNVVSFFNKHKPEKYDKQKHEHFVSISEFSRSIPGGSKNEGEHRKMIEEYLLGLKREKPNLILIDKGYNEKASAEEAIKYLTNPSNNLVFLYVDSRVSEYVEDNFIGKLERGSDFIKGSKLLRHEDIKQQDNRLNAAIVKFILKGLWQQRDKDYVDSEGRTGKIGDDVKRLVSGANTGIFIRESAVGTLITREQIIDMRDYVNQQKQADKSR
jgi:hypothetical protein